MGVDVTEQYMKPPVAVPRQPAPSSLATFTLRVQHSRPRYDSGVTQLGTGWHLAKAKTRSGAQALPDVVPKLVTSHGRRWCSLLPLRGGFSISFSLPFLFVSTSCALITLASYFTRRNSMWSSEITTPSSFVPAVSWIHGQSLF